MKRKKDSVQAQHTLLPVDDSISVVTHYGAEYVLSPSRPYKSIRKNFKIDVSPGNMEIQETEDVFYV